MQNDDSFPITIDVAETHVGKVLRLLDGTPGVINIHLRMNKEQSAARPVEPRKVMALVAPRPRVKESMGSLNDTVGHALSRGSMHYKILQEILRRNGYSGNSLYKAITELGQKKMVRRVAPGTYRLTEKGEKKYGLSMHQPKQISPPERRYPTPNNTKGVRSLVLRQLLNESINHNDLMSIISEAGYVKNNLYTIVPKMIEEGLVKKTNNTYEITSSGREAIVSLTSTPPGETNTDDGEAS